MNDFMNLQTSAFLNYKSMVLLVILGFVGDVIGWNWILISFEIVFFILLIITYIQTQLKTGYFKFFYGGNREKLDEREEEIFNKTLRTSYLVFSQVSIVLFLWFTDMFMESHNKPIVLSMWYTTGLWFSYMYFATTLPGMVMIWKRKALYNDEDLAEN